MSIKTQIEKMDKLVQKGQFMQAVEEFFHNKAVAYSNEYDVTSDKEDKKLRLGFFLNGVQKVNDITLHNVAMGEDVTMSEYTFDFTMNDGSKMVWNEVIRRRWADDKVVSEKYYTARNIDESKFNVDPASATVKVAAPAKASAKVKGVKDDLKIVEGIGPKIEELLNKAGIVTFADLASAKVTEVKAVLDAAGPKYRIHDPATWTAQAELARDGKMADLKVWQEKLIAGKKA
jgi:predicted flap endonuclease-1-like 5' DNA nuclease